jgi:hypothetical protein
VSKKLRKFLGSAAAATILEALIFAAPTSAQRLEGVALCVTANPKDGTYQLAIRGSQPIFTSQTAARLNHE